MANKKEKCKLIPLFEKRISEFAAQNNLNQPEYFFDDIKGQYSAYINRGSFVQLFRYYPDVMGSNFNRFQKSSGLGVNAYAPYSRDAISFDSVNVLYIFDNKAPYYCLYDIFNIFDIKDFSGCNQHQIFSERTMNKALDKLLNDAVKYDSYVQEISENDEMKKQLLDNFNSDAKAVLPSWKINGKTLEQQREAMDYTLAVSTVLDPAGYSKMLYYGLPHRALSRMYKADKKGRLTVFEKRYASYIEDNFDKFKEKKRSNLAGAHAVCVATRIITSSVLVPVAILLSFAALTLLENIFFGSELVLLDDTFYISAGIQAVTGFLAGTFIYPIAVRLIFMRKKEKLNDAFDYIKHYKWERFCRIISGAFIALLVAAGALMTSCGILNSPILGEEYVEIISAFSSERVQYEYSSFEYYAVAAVFEDEEIYDDSRELVLKFDNEEYYFTQWYYPDELEKYISRIELNGGKVIYKDNLGEVDEYFRD